MTSNKTFAFAPLAMTAFFIAASSASIAQAAHAPVTAEATIQDAQGKKVGTARFMQEKAGVRIFVSVDGLTPGLHGIHIHENAKCDGPDFKSAGGHFNPEKTHHHGTKNPQGPHAGDLKNLDVDHNGKAKAEFFDKHVTLEKKPNSLLKEGGTSIVIHAKEDDEKTDPAGASGDRIACGVIEAAK